MNRKQRGYSLVELMVVLIIVIVTSAGGLYGWQRWQQQQRLWQTVQQLRSFLVQLREDANWNNRNHSLWFSSDAQRWCVGSEQSGERRCRNAAAWQFHAPWPEIRLLEVTNGLGFYGLRNTAWPGHIRLGGAAGTWRIIISAWGRLRVCNEQEGASCR